MIYLLLFCASGLVAGFLLLFRVPVLNACTKTGMPSISVIIPARNEENNLPRLLTSLKNSDQVRHEVIVIDDDSTDRTASVAAACGAKVHSSRNLPTGWTGKTWACFQGAEIARGDVFVFLDADTWFETGGFETLISSYRKLSGEVALSILPFQVTRKPYEELSFFFNLLVAFGAGGFGWLGGERLFGPSLIISRSLYQSVGGHAAVRDHILENVELSGLVKAVDGRCMCVGGRGTLNVRMFPAGVSQLWEGWMKAFADGASATDSRVLLVVIGWVSSLAAAFLLLMFATGTVRTASAFIYAAFALQLWWFSRQLGTYHPIACILYPIPLLFFFSLFSGSFIRRMFKLQVTWRGRQL
jgi:4,4'-diaponeurosporenoate glycosyltransferase